MTRYRKGLDSRVGSALRVDRIRRERSEKSPMSGTKNCSFSIENFLK